ncbi:MAG: hypothetical protein K6F79_08595 [Saccharofermentans sp.]|nr:hypothetical protein [Saccharofermentans sp.]
MGLADDLRKSTSNITGREQQKRLDAAKEAEKKKNERRKKLKEEAKLAVESIHSLCIPQERHCTGYIFPIDDYRRNIPNDGGTPYASKKMYPSSYPVVVESFKRSGYNLNDDAPNGFLSSSIKVGDSDMAKDRKLTVYKSKDYCYDLKRHIELEASKEGFIEIKTQVVPINYVNTFFRVGGTFFHPLNTFVDELSDNIAGYTIQFEVSW